MHTPYGKDIIKDYVSACRRHNLLPFFYHTTLDWQKPEFRTDFPAYQKYLRESIRLLCTNYGKIGGFWFDGNWSDYNADWEEDALYSLIRKYQPDAIITNNTGLEARGVRGNQYLDTVTFEQGHLQDDGTRNKGRHLAMEACETMNHHWGSAGQDLDYHPVSFFIEELNRCRRNNANYLLNIGPDGDGSVPLMAQAILHEMGIWTQLYQDTFYDGKLSQIRTDENTYVLDKGRYSDVYCSKVGLQGVEHVVEEDTAEDNLRILTNVSKKAKKIYWLDNQESLPFEQNGDTIRFHATGYPYGRYLVVRAARIEWE